MPNYTREGAVVRMVIEREYSENQVEWEDATRFLVDFMLKIVFKLAK